MEHGQAIPDYLNRRYDEHDGETDNENSDNRGTGDDGDDVADDEEVFYVPLDLSSTPQTLDHSGDVKIVGLHTDQPIISVGPRVYEGQWQDLIGTDMFFSQQGELIATTRKHIRLVPGKLVKKADFIDAGAEAGSASNGGGGGNEEAGRYAGIDWTKPMQTKFKKQSLIDRIKEIDAKRSKDDEGHVPTTESPAPG
ncbi:TFIIIC subunit-domain-containing protein [Lipomyces japonicus]|uniref:TFIIIC subunit-domain-containing protein n=1 Tax=Lipomyces japonicus TaxID=56871 RepID=UPI0034CD1825